MSNFICQTCGVQFTETAVPPTHCPICADDRQYINQNGQQWTTLAEMQQQHHNLIKPVAANLTGIGTEPKFAIGQRALLLQTAQGNVLWDCISYLDEATITAVNELGGIDAIAISHPHFYSSMVEWSHTFAAPIYLHESSRQWVMRPDADIHFWEGDTKSLWDGLTLVCTGGHFPGSTLLHWADGADGQGAIFTADTIMVVADRRYVSFMYSYPNLIPLSAASVQQIVDAVEPYDFAQIYSGWWDAVVREDGKTAVKRSATRYIEAIQAEA
jgi:glyoxylase-like metal-dependent hydrolase (beta-lactamase superfamily II)